MNDSWDLKKPPNSESSWGMPLFQNPIKRPDSNSPPTSNQWSSSRSQFPPRSSANFLTASQPFNLPNVPPSTQTSSNLPARTNSNDKDMPINSNSSQNSNFLPTLGSRPASNGSANGAMNWGNGLKGGDPSNSWLSNKPSPSSTPSGNNGAVNNWGQKFSIPESTENNNNSWLNFSNQPSSDAPESSPKQQPDLHVSSQNDIVPTPKTAPTASSHGLKDPVENSTPSNWASIAKNSNEKDEEDNKQSPEKEKDHENSTSQLNSQQSQGLSQNKTPDNIERQINSTSWGQKPVNQTSSWDTVASEPVLPQQQVPPMPNSSNKSIVTPSTMEYF